MPDTEVRRITIRLPAEKFHRLKLLSAMDDEPVQRIVERLIDEELYAATLKNSSEIAR